MLLHWHFLLSLIPGGILFYFNRIGALIFIIINILIDFDHYIVYIFKFKNLNLKKAYNYFASIKECKDLAVFHTVEFIIFVLIVSYFYEYLFFVFLALTFHLILDIYDVFARGIKRPFSFVSWFKNRRTIK